MKTAIQNRTAPAAGKRNRITSDNLNTIDDLKRLAAMIPPSEELIRQLAESLYHDRSERGETGTPEDDWFRAEQVLTTIE